MNRFRVKRVDHGRRLGGANSTARQFAEGSGGIRGPFSLDETVPSGVPEIRFGKLDCDLAKPDASSWWRGFILAKRIPWSRHCLQRWTAFFVSSLDETGSVRRYLSRETRCRNFGRNGRNGSVRGQVSRETCVDSDFPNKSLVKVNGAILRCEASAILWNGVAGHTPTP